MAVSGSFQRTLTTHLENISVALAEAHASYVAELHDEIDALKRKLELVSARRKRDIDDPEEQEAKGKSFLPNVMPFVPRTTSESSSLFESSPNFMDSHGDLAWTQPGELQEKEAPSLDALPVLTTSESQLHSEPAVLSDIRKKQPSKDSCSSGQPISHSPTSPVSASSKSSLVSRGRRGSYSAQRLGSKRSNSRNMSAEPDLPVVQDEAWKGWSTDTGLQQILPTGMDTDRIRHDVLFEQVYDGEFSRETSTDDDNDDGQDGRLTLAKIWVQLRSMAFRSSSRDSTGRGEMRRSLSSYFDKETRKLSGASLTWRNRKNQSYKVRTKLFLQSMLFFEPYQAKRLTWELCGAIMLMHDIFVLPVMIAFEPAPTPSTEIMVWFVRLFWTLDIAVGFVTGYVDEQGIVVMSLRRVSMNYLRGSFPLDFIIVVIDWFDAIIGVRATGFLKSWRLLRLMRLLRLRKAQKLWDSVSEYVAAEQLGVLFGTVKNSLVLLVILHFIACAWWSIGLVQPGKSWNDDLGMLPLSERYFWALHFSMSIFFGEHIIEPQNQVERILTIVFLYTSFLWQIWFVSSITTVMTHLEIVSSRRSRLFSALSRFLAAYKVPLELQLKLHRSARHNLETREMNTQESSIELLKLVSEPLMMRLHCEMFLPIVRVVPWLRCFCELREQATMQLCHYGMRVEEISKEEVIFLEDDKPLNPCVRLLISGLLHYSTSGDIMTVDKRHWLSEMVLWTDGWVHKGTLQADIESRILVLDAEQFRQIIGNGVDGREISLYAEILLQQSNPEELLDIMEYKSSLDAIMACAFAVGWENVKGEFNENSSQRPQNASQLLHCDERRTEAKPNKAWMT